MWVRLLGLPLFLWDNAFFKQFGDACGSFITVDKDTAGCRNLNWARILVRIVGENTPSSLQVVVQERCFSIPLWWEFSPRVSVVEPCKGGHKLKVGDDLECDSRARARVGPIFGWIKGPTAWGWSKCEGEVFRGLCPEQGFGPSHWDGPTSRVKTEE